MAGWLGVVALAGSIVGLGLATRGRQDRHHLWLVAGWLAFVLALIAGSIWRGPEIGIAFVLLALSLFAYVGVAIGLERKPPRARPARNAAFEPELTDPEQRPVRWVRGVVRSLIAFLVAGSAAAGVGLSIAVYLPINEIDRLALGGIVVPTIWAAGMAWTLAETRLVRAFVPMMAVAAVGIGAAFLA